jgi:mRNA deadenylase 3'-5' endonuclease subunit Ccr4
MIVVGADACSYVVVLTRLIVGRELFPGSDCLRWGDRKPMLLAEMASYSTADVICLQVRRDGGPEGLIVGM